MDISVQNDMEPGAMQVSAVIISHRVRFRVVGLDSFHHYGFRV